jgi:hypothetical protein
METDDEIIDKLRTLLAGPGDPSAGMRASSHGESMRQGLLHRGDVFGRSDILLLQAADGAALRVPVSALPMEIGSEADGRVAGRGVSRRHCRLDRDGAFVRLVDLGSTNGTLLNGRSVESTWLCDGDLLTLGQANLSVRRC